MSRPFLTRIGIALLFLVSGATALVYEILWTRQFVTVFGNSTYSISIVLSAFMGGLGVGGLFFGKRADQTRDPLRLYALLEFGIAGTAMLVPLLIVALRAFTPALFTALPADVLSVGAVRLVFAFAVLFVPCTLIGGTLPVLARFCVETRDVVGQRIGLLYGLNVLGGAFGCFLAAFYLVGELGIAATGWLAVAANVAIGLVALLIRARWGADALLSSAPAEPEVGAAGSTSERASRLLLFVALLSGFTTLGSEVLWTRFLAIFCPNTPYMFAAVLGFFLVGLACGSLIYRLFLARLTDRLLTLGVMQVLVGFLLLGSLLLGSWYVVSSGPGASTRITAEVFGRLGADGDSLLRFVRPFAWSLLAPLMFVFLPTLAMGTVFPLVCAVVTPSVSRIGRSIGLTYGLNTAGCILGSLAPVFFLVPSLGIQNSLVGIAVLNVAVGAFVLWRSGTAPGVRTRSLRALLGGACLVLVVATAFRAPADLTQRIFLHGLPSVRPESRIVHYGEGRTGTALVVEDPIDGMYDLFVNAVLEVPPTYLGQGVFRLMGHLGPLLHPDPSDVAVVCFGGGIAGGALSLYPAVKSLEIVDIEGSVIEAARVLREANNDIHESDKLTVHIEDGRNFLLTCGRTYPLIVSDSSHPKSADSWVLYTQEYYRIVDRTLDDDGVFVQWLPYHGLSEKEFKIILRTFQSVFPHTSVWLVFGADERGEVGGHSIMIAQKGGTRIDPGLLAERLAVPEVARDLAPYVMDTTVNLLRHFVCGPAKLREWTEGLPVNTDDKPITQYRTEHSIGPGNQASSNAMFIPVLESPAPYLVEMQRPEKLALVRELDTYIQARILILDGFWGRAEALLPGDGKLALFKRLRRLSLLHSGGR